MVQLSQTMRLEQRLSPQQILLSTLLQLPLLSLEQKIQTELELNPVLEEGIEEDDELEVETIESDPEETKELEQELQLTEDKNNTDLDSQELEKAQEDAEWDELINDDNHYEFKLPKDHNEEDYERPEVEVSSMTDHLLEQLNYLKLDDIQKKVGEYLIWNIRDDGYLDEALLLENVAEIFEYPFGKVEEVLKMIHFFDPVGIGSRNLQECLLTQLIEKKDTPQLAVKILSDHFEDFKNKRYDKLLAIMDINAEELKEVLEIVGKLNPKPGEGLITNKDNYLIPDFVIEKVDNEFVVTLNDWNIPPLRISKTYKTLLKNRKNTDKETRQYIRKKIETAKWFINSIYQRKATMIKVMNAIVQKQYDFFDKGPAHINPLIMREIADIIEMDISTVSRVANGKYVQTDYGVFELKYFFNEKIETDDGEEVSTRKVKERIRGMIKEESSQKPLSDEKISQILNEEGFPVARRTVAKYREQLSVPVARLRKKLE
jgi:RNA polymerase sigma-54 factor